ncbi:uncharacterized protein LOC100909020 [Galendromus occidentalis]|uniref:Uncharacterized protein LOC100909020 n=1 Tax=Galendromus occidentalis TaxID=34638 RepID=A0AAJ6QTD6_9ACAR|nr:uncharacterized protein LOC100909020 [Galendromus occidentalis]
MADEAAKRRVLRKQRILGNSENRLKRILNKEGELNSEKNYIIAQGVSLGASLTNVESQPEPSSWSRNGLELDPLHPELGTAFANPAVTPLLSDLTSNLDASIRSQDFGSAAFLEHASNQQSDLFAPRPPLGMADLENVSGASNPMELLCRLAASLDGAKSGASQQKVLYQGPSWLVDTSSPLRVLFILLLGTTSRFLIPSLPIDFAILFGPLYILEVLLISLYFVYKAPFEQSSMSTLYSLLLLSGIHSKIVSTAKTLSVCIETTLRDLVVYSFSFFIAHALCHQLRVFEAQIPM